MGFSYKPLWRLLLDRDMTRTQYREALSLSSSTLAKMGKDEYTSMEVLDKTCTLLGVRIEEVIEHKKEQEG